MIHNWRFRFHSESLHGLLPADREQMTSEEPSWEIPAGMYDVGDGFYDPRTKCVSDPATGEILRYLRVVMYMIDAGVII